MKEKTKNIIIILLSLVVVLLIVLNVLALSGKLVLKDTSEDTNTNQENNITEQENKKYTYNEIKGLYKYNSENYQDTNGNEFSNSYNLYLYENGTFIYRMASATSFRYLGNYTIVDNEIILNHLFTTDSGVGATVTTGIKTLTINTNTTIVDPEENINELNLNSITLEKTNEEEEKTFLKNNDFNNILQNEHLINNTGMTIPQ